MFGDDEKNKNEKAKRYAIELMKNEIKLKGYDVEERFTNSTKYETSGQLIRLGKIFSLKYDGKFFEMSTLEEKMGTQIHKIIQEFFSKCMNNELRLTNVSDKNTSISNIPVFSFPFDNSQLIELNFVDLIPTKTYK